MNPPAYNGTCGICMVKAATGSGQAIFIGECSHSFHFSCIAKHIPNGNSHCPICHVQWKDLPFSAPPPNNQINWNHGLFHPTPTPTPTPTPNPFSFSPFPPPQFPSVFPPFQFTPFPALEPEPHHYTDDEPLPPFPPRTDAVLSASLQKASIKATPERAAVAASESIAQFSVLVGIKAPSLSDDAFDSRRAPIDLVLVLDVSGSMHGSKLDLVKRAVHFVVDNLRPSDRLAIVSFSDRASRVLRLARMTENGRGMAKRAVDSLCANGGTNIVEGLKKGVRVLEERREKNPVSSIVFLSDGNDTCYIFSGFPVPGKAPKYLHLLPASICPKNKTSTEDEQVVFPVHAFGFGLDHDPMAMHAISDASGGSFSFIESVEMVQDAFASCIGGLLSVVMQNLLLVVKSASHGVEIKSIPSGRYAIEISNQGSDATIKVGDLYADEDREFLINLSVPKLLDLENSENEKKTSLLDITCSYKDVVTKQIVLIEADLVEIRRPESLPPQEMVINLEVDRQRNRLLVADSIAEAQRMAESGNLSRAQTLLTEKRLVLAESQSCQAGDGLCKWLEGEINETQRRMGSRELYEQSGRAFALSGMSSHCMQRAATRGNMVPGAGGEATFFGSASTAFGGYATPFMAKMVDKSQQVNKTESSSTSNATPMEE